jgi:hypothetical protein
MIEVCNRGISISGKLVRVARVDGEGYDFLQNPESDLQEIRRCGRRIDLFTFVQKLCERSPTYAYPMEWENFAVLPISTFDNWMTHQIDFKARNKARKAGKNGVSVREVPFDDNLIRGISAVYNETPIRQGRRFPHYGKDLAALRRMKSTFLERSIFIGAFLGDELIGFIKLVMSEDRSQAGLMHILSMARHRDKAPTNALIAQAVRTCAQRGIPSLWYANFSYGKKKDDSLAEFKRHNGFQRVDVPRYFVPFNLVGRLALKCGLQHESKAVIPETVASRFRKMRSLWYAKRFPSLEQ